MISTKVKTDRQIDNPIILHPRNGQPGFGQTKVTCMQRKKQEGQETEWVNINCGGSDWQANNRILQGEKCTAFYEMFFVLTLYLFQFTHCSQAASLLLCCLNYFTMQSYKLPIFCQRGKFHLLLLKWLSRVKLTGKVEPRTEGNTSDSGFSSE